MTDFLRSSAEQVPHIVIVDECGCRRARAAALVLEAWLDKQGVLATVDEGPSAFWQKFIPCEVQRRSEARREGRQVSACPVCDPSAGHWDSYIASLA